MFSLSKNYLNLHSAPQRLHHAKGVVFSLSEDELLAPKIKTGAFQVLSHSGEGGPKGVDVVWDCSAASHWM